MSIHTRPWRLPLVALLLGLSGAALAHNRSANARKYRPARSAARAASPTVAAPPA